MKKIIPFLYVVCVTLLLALVTGCSSTGGSTSYYHGNTTYYHGSSWNYDTYYRSGVQNNYNRSAAAAAHVRSGGGGARSGGGGRGRR